MPTRSRGRKRLRYPSQAPDVTPIFDYHAPGVSFESDNLTDEEIEKLSGEVITYKASDQLRLISDLK